MPEHLLTEYACVYSKILGSEAQAAAAGKRSYAFDIAVSQGSGRSNVVLRTPGTEEDVKLMQERGIGFSHHVIAITSDGLDGISRRALGSTGIASTVLLEKSSTESVL